MTSTVIPLYPEDPHVTVSAKSSLTQNSERDFDLESTIQFVTNGHAALFDFSMYGFVSEDLSDLDDVVDQVDAEVAAFRRLQVAVTEAYHNFCSKAQRLQIDLEHLKS